MEFYPICDETLALSPNLWYSVSGTGESPFMRVGHTITQYKGSESDVNKRGSLVLVGGATPSECFKDVYVLDLHTLAWSKFEDGKALETGRYEHACFQDKEDNVYVFGGADMERNYNDIIRIDVENKVCEPVKIGHGLNEPMARTYHGGVNLKNQLLVYGGGEAGQAPVMDGKIYVFNAHLKKWIGLQLNTESPSLRHGHVMVNVNNQLIYMHGGMNSEGLLDDFWVLNVKEFTWSRVPVEGSVRPCARAAHGAVSVGKAVYIFGGMHGNGGALDDLWKYETELNQWSQVEVFGYKPPARLDFAYCKMSFLNDAAIPEASETVATTEQLKTANGRSSSNTNLVLESKIQELNLMEGKLGPLEESDGDEDGKAEVKKKVEETIKQEIEPVKEEPKDQASIKEEPADKQQGERTCAETKSKEEDSTPKLMNFMVIHGGMDTEGNVYDDCFFIHLLP